MPYVQDPGETGRAVNHGDLHKLCGRCRVSDERTDPAIHSPWNGDIVFA